MQIVVTSTDRQWEELMSTPSKTEWLRVSTAASFAQMTEADAFINLHEDAHLFDYSAIIKPVLINAVAITLHQMKAPLHVLRINGWFGFLQRPVWEIAGETNAAVIHLFEGLNKRMCFVKDEPGFIAARIIAMIINEAYFTLGDNVSTKADIDTAMKLGTNYPFGPFEWAAGIGLNNIYTLLQKLYATDLRYKPAAMLIKESINNNS